MQRRIVSILVLFIGVCGCSGAIPVSGDAGTDGDAVTDGDAGTDDGCTQPDAVPQCADGWCRIEPGCFELGSPLSEPCRGAYSEDQVQVTLTRPFEVQQHEVTQAEWEAAGFVNPSTDVAPDKPVMFVNWYESMAYANALSEERGLEPCYALDGCVGIIGSGCPDGYEFCFEVTFPDDYVCDYDPHLYANWYECQGYRLPTSAEWEYAARAGTTTATYNGDILVATEDTNEMEPVLEPIAWYRYNAATEMQPICGKQPNGWGLYDMLGNASEWIDYIFTGGSLAWAEEKDGPLTDPMGTQEDPDRRRSRKGRSNTSVACRVRAASHIEYFSSDRSMDGGFRLVRTLPE